MRWPSILYLTEWCEEKTEEETVCEVFHTTELKEPDLQLSWMQENIWRVRWEDDAYWLLKIELENKQDESAGRWCGGGSVWGEICRNHILTVTKYLDY